MIRVRSLEEAQSLARELCKRHEDLMQSATGMAASPRDVALKIFLAEMGGGDGQSIAGSPSPARSTTGSGLFANPASPSPARMSTTATNASATVPISSSGGKPSPGATAAAASSSAMTAMPSTVGSSVHGGADAQASRLEACAYCNEPSSRYCKETGRRHETSGERATRLWRTIFRQLQCASHFIDTARLNKPNSCVEDYAVELNLDDV